MDNNIFGQTDIGRVRANNEDAFLAEELLNSGFILGCVIDGVGGYEGGEVAASIAKECIIKKLYNITAEDIIPKMIGTLKLANDEIYNRKQLDPSLEQMACVITLVLADIENNKFYYVHVGDTRLYLLRDHGLVKITQDDSFVGFLEDSGRLTESAAMSHPKRNEINQALGFSDTLSMKDDFFESGESPFLPGDILLLCSDGLTDRIDKDQITVILTQNATLRAATNILVDAANEAGGEDNITVVLVKNNNAPFRHEVAKSAVRTAAAIPETKNSIEPLTPATLGTQELVKTTKPSKNNKSRGWIVFLLVLVFLLLGVVAYMFWQVDQLQKRERQLAPVYENPWVLPIPDTTKTTDTLKKEIAPDGKRETQ